MTSMTLAAFIRANLRTILDDWLAFATNIPAARGMDLASLLDHGRGILEAIAADLEVPQSAGEQEKKSKGLAPTSASSQAQLHGAARVLEGFSVTDAMAEYRALRASVLRAFSAAHGPPTPAVHDITRFNEAVDQALSESLARFSSDKERSNRLFDTLLSASPDLCFILDPGGKLIYCNKALATLTALPFGAMRGKTFAELRVPVPTEFFTQLQHVVDDRITCRGEMVHAAHDARLVFEYLLVPVMGVQDKVEAVAGTARDITERKANEEKIQRSAHYDFLTRLPNRTLFRDRLEHEIKRSARIGLPLALLFIDLDGFKDVNDWLGHDAGDELLRASAQRITSCVRDSDTVARLGGDEFTVILPEVRKMPYVVILAQQILDELSRPFSIQHKAVGISGSIGISVFPQDAATPAELLRHADKAMYIAKHAGRNRFSFFTDTMRDAAWARLEVIDELRRALHGHQLAVHYQPIVALPGNAIVGAEAQLRWQHPRFGLMHAQGFIGLAEEAGLIAEIDAWVLEQALAQGRAWRVPGGPPLPVNINKSATEFSNRAPDRYWDPGLASLAGAGQAVAVEITEAVLLSEAPLARQKLAQLAQAGVPLCVDDFGTGLSSMTRLASQPLASVKIDLTLISGGAGAPDPLAAAIIAGAHELGLKVIAEGVETTGQKDWLARYGCDYAQGYLFSEALPANAFSAVLAGAGMRT